MLKILHFADAHIDMSSQGKRDPQSGLPFRVLDFLKAMDTIMDTAIREKVDLVIFAGDAYKDRTPVPTFQREFGKRIMRLSAAGIPTLLLVGNHDLSPAIGRAHALQEFETLQVPNVHVISKPCLLKPKDLNGLPLQVIGLPWVSRSRMMAIMTSNDEAATEVYSHLEATLGELVANWLDEIDPTLPVVMTAHASVLGAKFGGERSVMLGNDLVLPGGMVRDPRLDYVALGHIHKAQNLNEGMQPPVVYPGSIERVDFGEASDNKYFVIAHVSRGKTEVEWRKLNGRRFIDRHIDIVSADKFTDQMIAALPSLSEMADAIVRLTVFYPREYETSLDEKALREYTETAFEFHLIRRPQMDARLRLPDNQEISSMDHLDLVNMYWKTIGKNPEKREELQSFVKEIISEARGASTDELNQ